MSLNGLNGFPALQDLVLDNNRLTEIRHLPYMPNLVTLSLNNNLVSENLTNVTHIYFYKDLITKH